MQVTLGLTPRSMKVCTVALKMGLPTWSLGLVRQFAAMSIPGAVSKITTATNNRIDIKASLSLAN
jgi:hypothetical protein